VIFSISIKKILRSNACHAFSKMHATHFGKCVAMHATHFLAKNFSEKNNDFSKNPLPSYDP